MNKLMRRLNLALKVVMNKQGTINIPQLIDCEWWDETCDMLVQKSADGECFDQIIIDDVIRAGFITLGLSEDEAAKMAKECVTANIDRCRRNDAWGAFRAACDALTASDIDYAKMTILDGTPLLITPEIGVALWSRNYDRDLVLDASGIYKCSDWIMREYLLQIASDEKLQSVASQILATANKNSDKTVAAPGEEYAVKFEVYLADTPASARAIRASEILARVIRASDAIQEIYNFRHKDEIAEARVELDRTIAELRTEAEGANHE